MVVRSIATLVIASVLFVLEAASARGSDACWRLLYDALARSAGAAHAPFVTYSETIRLDQDGQTLERARAAITYRDDGVASIDDDRFARPFLSEVQDPGPPVLGPYGERRAAWTSFGDDDAPLPVIADTQTPHRHECVDRGDDVIEGGAYAHLTFPDAALDRPALKAVWIDRNTLQIRRAVVTGWLQFFVEGLSVEHALTDYTLQLTQVEGHTVLEQVNWQYAYRSYGETSMIEEEYRFGGYRFDAQAPPDSLFEQGHPKQQR
jgi:hypothetical protein